MNLVNSKLQIIEEESATAATQKDLEKPDLTAAQFKALLEKEKEVSREKNSRPH